ncbi:MAG TPA: hypothetical protein VG817_09780 [Gemmatimonadales bacterium]|nr:hypothetical protein [Gemmatimonadales bacterium]
MWVKERGELQPRRIEGADGVDAPFLSPDGAWIGYFARGALYKVASTGGAPVQLATNAAVITPSAVWRDDGTIVYSNTDFGLSLLQAEGGKATGAVPPHDAGLRFPAALPNNDFVLASICGNNCARYTLVVVNLKTQVIDTLLEGASRGFHLANGFVVAVLSDGSLVGAPFDIGTRRFKRTPAPLVAGVQRELGIVPFQMRHDSSGVHPGGLAELTPGGALVRAASAEGAGVPDAIRPYSAAIVPSLDRIVTTTTDMNPANPHLATELQVWKLSTLELLHTIALPPGPVGDENQLTAEPRLLSDGRTVMVSTFNCGLFLLDGLEGEQLSGQFVASFPRKHDTYCAIPVVAGHHWLVTVPAIPGVVSLDLSDPAAPREVSRLTLDSTDVPHWISLEPNGKRVVITGYGSLEHRVLLATFDSTTGALGLDTRFRPMDSERAGFETTGVPHGAVFSRP